MTKQQLEEFLMTELQKGKYKLSFFLDKLQKDDWKRAEEVLSRLIYRKKVNLDNDFFLELVI